jgi:hypothetical protein
MNPNKENIANNDVIMESENSKESKQITIKTFLNKIVFKILS